ncbi:MAG: hypothetical protein IGR76_04055 [Synechococcales cyanobacterium T60_A2020_003]|nr:hypothetical protein [Synechococcales cyanobacterium T60_A2020_003]
MNSSLIVGFMLVWDLLSDAIEAAENSEPQQVKDLVNLAQQKLQELEEDMRAIAQPPEDD